MRYFIIKSPWEKMPKDLYEIQSDPSLKYESYIFVKSKEITFEKVLDILLKTRNRNEYLGATSLIYFKYYDEFYDFLMELSKDSMLLKKHKKAILKFDKKVLGRWLDFIKYSDDTLYPQNVVFKKMKSLIDQKITN